MSRQRQGTHARNLPKEKDNSIFSFIPKEKRKTALIITLIVIAVLVTFFVLHARNIIRLGDHVHTTDDGIPNLREGEIVGKKTTTSTDSNGQNHSSTAFYTVGSFAGTEKYTYDPEYSASTDKKRTEWKFDSKQADPIYFMRVCGGDGKAAELCAELKQHYRSGEGDEAVFRGLEAEEVNANGLKYSYFVCEPFTVPDLMAYAYYGVEREDYSSKRAFAYVETAEDLCAVVSVYARADKIDDLPEDAALVKRMKEFVDLIYAQKPDGVETKEIQVVRETDGQEETLVSGYYAGTDAYQLDEDYSIGNKTQRLGWKYDGEAADPIYFMYVTGRDGSAKSAFESVKNSNLTTDEETGETSFKGSEKTGTSKNGLKYRWLCTAPQAVDDAEMTYKYGVSMLDYYTKYSYAFVETRDDMCVMIAVYAKTEAEDALPEDEAIFERSLEFINLISK